MVPAEPHIPSMIVMIFFQSISVFMAEKFFDGWKYYGSGEDSSNIQ